MTCEHGWVRHGPSTVVQLGPVTFPRFHFYYACWGRQEYLLAEMCGFCEPSRRRVAEVTCKARPATCATAFPTSPAARRWADCDDVATLRERGEAYEHAWVKAAARELDLMIEIQRLKRELDREKSLRFGQYERYWIAEHEAIVATSEDPEERDVARRLLAANRCTVCGGTGLVSGEWFANPDGPHHGPLPCPCQNLENA